MKGNNKFLFNQATMVGAMQEYVDEHFHDNVLVESVSFDINKSDFIIVTTEPVISEKE